MCLNPSQSDLTGSSTRLQTSTERNPAKLPSSTIPSSALTTTSQFSTVSSSSTTTTPPPSPLTSSQPTYTSNAPVTTSHPPGLTSGPAGSPTVDNQEALATDTEGHGLPIPAQIAVGVVVPVVVILMVVGLWMFLFRKPRPRRPARTYIDDSHPSFYPPTPPPAYSKQGVPPRIIARERSVSPISPRTRDHHEDPFEMLTFPRPPTGTGSLRSPPSARSGTSHTYTEQDVSPISTHNIPRT